ncbi:murein L,D-transpeptidase catalytic domain family protein [Sphingopyxis sp. OPL5]|jgi:chitosanase|uniref:murein L,D-transpeptidase catalytic domain-containing protein n=1 Tax=Sphingopyxis sp. OPL5 TaxID=2486273 RepID=UPI00164E2B1F|nr:murein L,D-transpeptidase catalytic domain family protein [Sphingopyxis sp. OPL5]QNO26113.1 murein L,D-transpeptidase catalytic domain family protein [Sphingopyxis sp. OPL5]
MKLTAGQRLICDRVINVFETGTVGGKYGAISIFKDGPGDIRQITYGRSQTTEYGNLKRLVEMYVAADGSLAAEFSPYLPKIGTVALVDDERFKSLLRKAGNEDPVMRQTQDRFFDEIYFQPAQKWADANGFTLPLSMLVIYDSFIHSGRIRKELRDRFPEATPAAGGREKVWIEQYVNIRDEWLQTHRNPEVRPSAYRTRDFQREVRRGNWKLDQIPFMANGTPVNDDGAAPPATLVAAVAPAPIAALPSRTDMLRQLAGSVGAIAPVERLIAYRDKYRPTSNPRYWAVVNFDLHSAKPRLFLFDCVGGTVSKHLCAHGRGSEGPEDDGYAEVFSNADGSNCTSLGIYHCDLTYVGAHGKSLYLDGLEATNTNARRRHIVMHGADYVSPSVIAQTGRIGRSLGCPAIEMGDVAKVIPALMGGSLLIHWKS